MNALIAIIFLVLLTIFIFWISSNPFSLNGFSLLQLNSKTEKPSQFVLFGKNGICSILNNGKWEFGKYNWSLINKKIEYWIFKDKNNAKEIFLEKTNNSSWIGNSEQKNDMPIVVWKMNKKKNIKPQVFHKIIYLNQFQISNSTLLPFYQLQILSKKEVELWDYNTISSIKYKALIRKIHPFYYRINIPAKNIKIRLFLNNTFGGTMSIQWKDGHHDMNISLPFEIKL